MANLDFPRGFIPVKGGERSTDIWNISPTNPEIGLYDLLERRTDGFVYPASATSITIIGSSAEHIAANSGGTVKVYDCDDTTFWAQADDANIAAQTDFDLNYDIVVGAPNSLTGQSIMEIDASTKAATATLPIKILRVANIISKEGNALGANVLVECIINNQLQKSTGVIG